MFFQSRDNMKPYQRKKLKSAICCEEREAEKEVGFSLKEELHIYEVPCQLLHFIKAIKAKA